jgi:hypothetical protein
LSKTQNPSAPHWTVRHKLLDMNLTAAKLRPYWLPGTLCLVSLVGGVAAGMTMRGASLEAGRLAERRHEVQALGPAEKDRLNHHYARFVKLERSQQEGLRKLQAELAVAPDADELRGVMQRYHAWVTKELNPIQRDELLKLADEPERRLQRVMELVPLSSEDLRVVRAWSRERLKERGVPEGSPVLWGMLFPPNRGFGTSRPFASGKGQPRPKPFTAEEFDLLASQLSPGPQAVLKRANTLPEKGQRVGAWLFFRSRSEDTRGGAPSHEELVRFFAEELTDEDRQWLLGLPLQDRNRELRQKYQAQRKGPSGFPGGKPRGSQTEQPRRAPPESAPPPKASGKNHKDEE